MRASLTASAVTLPARPEELAQASVSMDEAEKPAPRPRGSPGDANGSRERAPDDRLRIVRRRRKRDYFGWRRHRLTSGPPGNCGRSSVIVNQEALLAT